VAGLAIVIVSLLGIGITVIVAVFLVSSQMQQPAPGADADRPVYAEPEPGADPVEQATQTEQGGEYVPPQPVPGQPLRLAIPAVGIDVRVGSMAVPGDRRVDPPTPGSAYWLRDYSVLGADAPGTGYIAGHTYRGAGEAVFNPLFDPETREARIHAGDAIEVTTPEGVTGYTVTAVENYDKQAVPDETELWQDVPGRLVLVACWYNGADPATANMVVYAQRNPS
jgi:sortase (surface protein transpeptidase)